MQGLLSPVKMFRSYSRSNGNPLDETEGHDRICILKGHSDYNVWRTGNCTCNGP